MWYWLSKDADEKGREKLKAELHKPLPGRASRVSQGVVDYERSLFAASLRKNPAAG